MQNNFKNFTKSISKVKKRLSVKFNREIEQLSKQMSLSDPNISNEKSGIKIRKQLCKKAGDVVKYLSEYYKKSNTKVQTAVEKAKEAVKEVLNNYDKSIVKEINETYVEGNSYNIKAEDSISSWRKYRGIFFDHKITEDNQRLDKLLKDFRKIEIELVTPVLKEYKNILKRRKMNEEFKKFIKSGKKVENYEFHTALGDAIKNIEEIHRKSKEVRNSIKKYPGYFDEYIDGVMNKGWSAR